MRARSRRLPAQGISFAIRFLLDGSTLHRCQRHSLAEGQNLTMRAFILKLLIGVAIGLIVIAIFIVFGHSTTPV